MPNLEVTKDTQTNFNPQASNENNSIHSTVVVFNKNTQQTNTLNKIPQEENKQDTPKKSSENHIVIIDPKISINTKITRNKCIELLKQAIANDKESRNNPLEHNEQNEIDRIILSFNHSYNTEKLDDNLIYFVKLGLLESAKLMINQGATVSYHCLSIVLSQDDLKTFKFLLKISNLEESDYKNLISYALAPQYRVKYNLLLKKIKNPETLINIKMIKASRDGNVAVVKNLHSQGANIYTVLGNIINATALRLAIEYGNLKVIKYLLAYDAYTNASMRPLLTLAVNNYCNIEIIKCLVKHCAKIQKIPTDVSKALIIAAEYGYLDIVEYFLKQKDFLKFCYHEKKRCIIELIDRMLNSNNNVQYTRNFDDKKIFYIKCDFFKKNYSYKTMINMLCKNDGSNINATLLEVLQQNNSTNDILELMATVNELITWKNYKKLKQDIKNWVNSISNISEEDKTNINITLLNDNFLSSLKSLYQLVEKYRHGSYLYLDNLSKEISLLLREDITIDNLVIDSDSDDSTIKSCKMNLITIARNMIFAHGLVNIRQKHSSKLSEQEQKTLEKLLDRRYTLHDDLNVLIDRALDINKETLTTE